MRQQVVFDVGADGIFANVWELDGDGGAHGHDFLEVAVIQAGTGSHVTAHGATPAVPGSVFVLRPGAWHWYRDCHQLQLANCCLSVGALSGNLAFLRFIPAVERLLWRDPMAAGRRGVGELMVGPAAAREAAAAIGRLAAELERDAGGGTVQHSAQVLAILGLVVDHLPVQSTATTWPPAIRDVVDLLEDAPAQDWTLDDLAERVGLARSYLARLFKRHLGLPPLAYLARVRAEKAAILLSTTDISVGEIGGLVGWPDPNYFARRFRQLSGITPTVYRERSVDATPFTMEVGSARPIEADGSMITRTSAGARTLQA